ncbi:Protein transport protein SEC31 [Labeo rohita]|uniref:Protein transport protein SEC31 n=1 Tax=Labeo rohita TaxID=84645 RepID=A0ABQ8L527_LABRO|nr:Protein transport protein SEC31 [Labeo rohita]
MAEAEGDDHDRQVIKNAPKAWKADIWAHIGFYEVNGKLDKSYARLCPPRTTHTLPGQQPLHILPCRTEHRHESAAVREGPRESFADYMEWVLVSCRSSLTAEDDTSPTQDPEPSQPAPRHAEFEPEPTADDEPEPRATELKIATEPEPYTSDQVREPATSTMTGECKMERVRAMESPAHCTTAGGELDDNSGDLIDFSTEDLEDNSGDLIDFSTEDLEDNSGDLIDFSTEDLENNSGDLIDFFTEVSTCLVMPACMESPPTLPLLPMSTSVCSPLSPDSPSAHPDRLASPPPVQWVRPWVCQLPSASGLEDPSSPPPASESRTPPQTLNLRLHHGSQRPRLHGRPSVHQLHRAPSSFRLRPGGIGPSSPQDSVPTAAPCHSVPPPSSVAPAPPRTFGSPPTPRSPEPRAPPWPSGSSVSPWIFGSPSPPRAPPPAPPPAVPPRSPPGVVSLFSTMAPPYFGSTVGRHDGCGLGLAWLLLLRVPPEFSLAPPSESSPPWTLFIVLLPEDRPPPEPPPTMTLLFSLPVVVKIVLLPGGGVMYLFCFERSELFI